MGTFNTLVADISCTQCKNSFRARIQFKFGDTWQYVYTIGDKLKWGGNDIGKAGATQVICYGIVEDAKCPNCLHENQEDYDIYLLSDVITDIAPTTDLTIYPIENYGDYVIIN